MIGTILPVLIALGLMFVISAYGLVTSNTAANRLNATNPRANAGTDRRQAPVNNRRN